MRNPVSRAPSSEDLDRVDLHAVEALGRDVDFVGLRRLAELVGVVTWRDLARFRRLLEAERPARYRPPVHRVA